MIPARSWEEQAPPLVEVDPLESQTLQQTADRRGRVLLRRSQNAIGQGGPLHLTFRLLAHLRFQIWIGRHQHSSLPRIYSGLTAIKTRAEDLRRGKMQMNMLAIHF